MNRIAACSILFGLLVSFQNCSMVGSSHTEVNSLGKTCATMVQKTYRDTYYPLIRQQCAGCHSDGGKGRIYFASYNFATAAENFANTGRSKIEALWLTKGHQGNSYNGPENKAFIDRYASRWAESDAMINQCIADSSVQTTYKNTPTGALINADNGDTNTEKWTKLEWDMATELLRSDLMGKIKFTLSIQYRRLILSGATVGYEFRLPTGRLNASAPAGTSYTIYGLRFYQNDHLLADATAYQSITATVNAATAQSLITGNSGNALAPVTVMDPVNDKFSIRFTEIRDGNGAAIGVTPPIDGGAPAMTVPLTVSYTQLMDATSPLGIFAKSCVRCHNTMNKNGTLDLTVYSAALLSAAKINTRIHSAASPMPTAGLMPQFDQDVVTRWIDNGAPQN